MLTCRGRDQEGLLRPNCAIRFQACLHFSLGSAALQRGCCQHIRCIVAKSTRKSSRILALGRKRRWPRQMGLVPGVENVGAAGPCSGEWTTSEAPRGASPGAASIVRFSMSSRFRVEGSCPLRRSARHLDAQMVRGDRPQTPARSGSPAVTEPRTAHGKGGFVPSCG